MSGTLQFHPLSVLALELEQCTMPPESLAICGRDAALIDTHRYGLATPLDGECKVARSGLDRCQSLIPGANVDFLVVCVVASRAEVGRRLLFTEGELVDSYKSFGPYHYMTKEISLCGASNTNAKIAVSAT